jgi:hypothetical protein
MRSNICNLYLQDSINLKHALNDYCLKYAQNIQNTQLGIGLLIHRNWCLAGMNYFFNCSMKIIYFPKFLLTGIVVAFMGLGFILFPGRAPQEGEAGQYLKHIWKESSGFQKFMWILFTLAGAAVGIWVFVYFDLNM